LTFTSKYTVHSIKKKRITTATTTTTTTIIPIIIVVFVFDIVQRCESCYIKLQLLTFSLYPSHHAEGKIHCYVCSVRLVSGSLNSVMLFHTDCFLTNAQTNKATHNLNVPPSPLRFPPPRGKTTYKQKAARETF